MRDYETEGKEREIKQKHKALYVQTHEYSNQHDWSMNLAFEDL